MIEKAIEYRQTLTRVQLIAALMSLYKEEKYALKKSVGSIGGAVSQEFLYYNQKMTLTQDLNEILSLN